MLLSYAIFFKMKQTEVGMAHWLDGFLPSRTAGLAARGGLMLAGFLYAQLISGGAIKALNIALRSDWAVSRKGNYLLLVPPFALVAPFAVVAAVVAPGPLGLLGGIAVHFGTLYAGYRYTSEPPGTTLQTLKLLRRRPASRRPASSQARAQHPAAGRPPARGGFGAGLLRRNRVPASGTPEIIVSGRGGWDVPARVRPPIWIVS